MDGAPGHPSTVARRRVRSLAAVWLTAVAVAAVSLLAAGPAVLHAGGQTVLVRSDPTVFGPARLTVVVGDTVTWAVEPGTVHTVTSGTYNASGVHPDGRFDSGSLSPGETFGYVFTEPGDYPYVCAIHADSGMVGRITVVADGAAESSSPVEHTQSPPPTSAPPPGGGSDGGTSATIAALVIAIALASATAILIGRRARSRSRA